MSAADVSTTTPSAKPKVEAIGGAGGGTLLVLAANSLPPHSGMKPYLLWAAPSASLAMTSIWLWAKRRAQRYADQRTKEAKRREDEALRQQFEESIEEAERTLERALANPKASKAVKAQAQARLDRLHMTAIDQKVARVDELAALLDSEDNRGTEPVPDGPSVPAPVRSESADA